MGCGISLDLIVPSRTYNPTGPTQSTEYAWIVICRINIHFAAVASTCPESLTVLRHTACPEAATVGRWASIRLFVFVLILTLSPVEQP